MARGGHEGSRGGELWEHGAAQFVPGCRAANRREPSGPRGAQWRLYRGGDAELSRAAREETAFPRGYPGGWNGPFWSGGRAVFSSQWGHGERSFVWRAFAEGGGGRRG